MVPGELAWENTHETNKVKKLADLKQSWRIQTRPLTRRQCQPKTNGRAWSVRIHLRQCMYHRTWIGVSNQPWRKGRQKKMSRPLCMRPIQQTSCDKRGPSTRHGNAVCTILLQTRTTLRHVNGSWRVAAQRPEGLQKGQITIFWGFLFNTPV